MNDNKAYAMPTYNMTPGGKMVVDWGSPGRPSVSPVKDDSTGRMTVTLFIPGAQRWAVELIIDMCTTLGTLEGKVDQYQSEEGTTLVLRFKSVRHARVCFAHMPRVRNFIESIIAIGNANCDLLL